MTAELEMSDGTNFARTQAAIDQLRLAAERAAVQLDAQADEGQPPVVKNIYAVAGRSPAGGGPVGGQSSSSGAIGHVVVRLSDPEIRTTPTQDFENAWRNEVGEIAGVKKLSLSASVVDAGAAVALELSLPDGQDITPVVADVKQALENRTACLISKTTTPAGGLSRPCLKTRPGLSKATRSGFTDMSRLWVKLLMYARIR